jgi:hypothetical protein
MRAILALAGAGLFLAAASVNAASLCNCCASGVAQSCSAICAPAKPAPGQCLAMIDHDGQATIAPGENPLYGISLLSLSLEDAARPQLEDLRRLLENSRRGLEKDRKASIRDFRKDKIDAATAQANGKRYEDAIVNYYLGLRAYRDRLAAVPKK